MIGLHASNIIKLDDFNKRWRTLLYIGQKEMMSMEDFNTCIQVDLAIDNYVNGLFERDEVNDLEKDREKVDLHTQ